MAQKRDYQGKPLEIRETLQRLAIRQKREDNPELVKKLLSIPKVALSAEQTKRLPDFLKADMVTCVFEDGKNVLWLGTNEGLWRVNEKEPEPLDKVQCFRAMAYMLDNEVEAVDGDGADGVFVLTKTSVSHIAMKAMSAKEKAVFLSEVNRKYVQRRGMLSGARWDKTNNCWRGRESDNDGLWTSLVAMGDICRYAVLRDDRFFHQGRNRAREGDGDKVGRGGSSAGVHPRLEGQGRLVCPLQRTGHEPGEQGVSARRQRIQNQHPRQRPGRVCGRGIRPPKPGGLGDRGNARNRVPQRRGLYRAFLPCQRP